MTTSILQLAKFVSYLTKEKTHYGTQYQPSQGSRIETAA